MSLCRRFQVVMSQTQQNATNKALVNLQSISRNERDEVRASLSRTFQDFETVYTIRDRRLADICIRACMRKG